MFGSGSRAPVSIMILVKNPNAAHNSCRIHYREIGNYLNREEKLGILREAVSISGFSDWQTLTPDKHHDWIEQRSDAFGKFYPMGSESAKAGKADDAIFGLYSLGLATSRDTYIYNFSHDTCAANALKITQDYLNALQEIENNPKLMADEVALRHANHIKWEGNLKDNLKRKKKTLFQVDDIRKVAYRPFVEMNGYVNYTFIARKYQMDRIFQIV